MFCQLTYELLSVISSQLSTYSRVVGGGDVTQNMFFLSTAPPIGGYRIIVWLLMCSIHSLNTGPSKQSRKVHYGLEIEIYLAWSPSN